jgi:formate hydrogenlyase subunit 6/NADH:ubiquinone oxidoreductase subunit I
MAKDFSQTTWHGVPRQDIPWHPTVNMETCIGCELCYVTCGREVFEMVTVDDKRKSKVERPYNCMVGCSTCGVVCPTEAISFPSRDIVTNIEREYKIFKVVRQEAQEKHGKAAMAARQKAQEQVDTAPTRVAVRIAGVFGEKRFLTKLNELIQDRPYDIMNVQLHVPTVKGLSEGTPAYMDFEATSTSQQDVRPLLADLKALVAANGLVWVEER